MQERTAIIGDGQMALVTADVLAFNGHAVRLWGPFPEEVTALKQSRRSPKRLPSFELPEQVRVCTELGDAVDGATVVINAIPTQFIRRVWERLRGSLSGDAIVGCVAKGIENETLLRPSEIIESCLCETSTRPMVAISGPTIAAELAQRLPATLLAASPDREAAARIQEMLGTDWLRVYTNDDIVGVELAGAVKNVIALAAGIVDGMKLGINAKSALLARGLAEIVRLGNALGAKAETFFGVAGVGDLSTTCFSPQSRNRTTGERLGRGETLEDIIASTASVVEGVATTRSVIALAQRAGVEMPITRAVHAILFEGLNPKDAMQRLMAREQKPERIA